MTTKAVIKEYTGEKECVNNIFRLSGTKGFLLFLLLLFILHRRHAYARDSARPLQSKYKGNNDLRLLQAFTMKYHVR